MSIEVLYLPKNFIPPKRISGYATGDGEQGEEAVSPASKKSGKNFKANM